MNKRQKNAAVAWYQNHFIDWALFEYHVSTIREKLLSSHPGANKHQKKPKILNLCADRYHFLVTFTASILEGRTTVMPSNRSTGEISRMSEMNNNIQHICDADIVDLLKIETPENSNVTQWEINLIPDDMIVAELYTSGSTGTPTANTKSWQQLVNGARQIYTRFGLDHFSSTSIIATVPPQHMFGFEMCIMMPLVCGVTIHHEQPFYPLDIQQSLNEMPPPRIMVTTPIHLKACNTLTEGWPPIEFIISATAPMPKDVASTAENILKTEVREIYGCSEVGAIATRRSTQNPSWELLPDYTLTEVNKETLIAIPSSDKPIKLPDIIKSIDEQNFRLLGRNSDLIKIGGKRGSLADVTARIKKIEGVEDAVVFMPDQANKQRSRLAALVVAPEMSAEQIRQLLANEVDPAFLPRPLCVIAELPYNTTGKLVRDDLLNSLQHYIKESEAC